MKREEEFVKNGAILLLGTVFPKLTALITLPIITGCLSKVDYGLYETVLTLVSLVLPIATLQMQSSAFRFLISARGDETEKKKIITNIYLFTIPVCAITLFVTFFFLRDFENSTRFLMLIYFFVDILLVTSRQVVRGLSRNLLYALSVLTSAVVEMIYIVVFVYKRNGGLNEAILALIISQTVSLLFVLFVAKIPAYIDLSAVSFSEIKKLLDYSWPMVPNSLSSWVMRGSDKLILLANIGAEATAVYGAANKLPNLFSLVQTSFSMAWQENASVTVDDEDAAAYYGKMFNRVLSFFSGAMVVLIAFTPFLFKVLIKGDYSESFNHMLILYPSVLFSALSAFISGVYIAHMRSKEIGLSTALAAAVNFLLSILFVSKMGIYAASLSTLISYLLLVVYRLIDVQRIQKMDIDVKRIILYAAALLAATLICYQRKTALDLINMVFSVFFALLINKELVGFVAEIIKTRIILRKRHD